MILIDEDVDLKLAAALESLRDKPDATRCIYFSLMDKPAIAGIKEKIIASAKQHIATVDTKVYLCGDADICILAPIINSKAGKEFILDVAAHANMPANGEWVTFFEVSLQINKLLITVEQKLEKLRKQEEELQKLTEQQRHERKRRYILSGGSSSTSEEIKSRRCNRCAPELMMIEDDLFSRRLVENVLQKKYNMTGLSEATYALDKYTNIAPDLLFLDINLPDVTGHELLEKILILDPDAYVVMFSGNSYLDNVTNALSNGASGFISKPFKKEKMRQYIQDSAMHHRKSYA